MLIVRLAVENGWRARKIQAELEKLGFTVSLATVSRYLPKREPDDAQRQRWMTFLFGYPSTRGAPAGLVLTSYCALRRTGLPVASIPIPGP